MINHIIIWNRWRKYYEKGHYIYKLKVLFKIVGSPSFERCKSTYEYMKSMEALYH